MKVITYLMKVILSVPDEGYYVPDEGYYLMKVITYLMKVITYLMKVITYLMKVIPESRRAHLNYISTFLLIFRFLHFYLHAFAFNNQPKIV